VEEIVVRIVSLIASSTEIVCALGLREQLVGRSHECDYPPEVKDLPVCTQPKFAEGTSYQIDERVKAILQEGLSVYRVEAGVLDRLAPDVVITQTQCDVCAVSLADVEAAVCAMIGSQPRIVALEPNALEDIFADVGKVAAALQVPERGDRLVAELRARLQAVQERAAEMIERPTVACIEWIEPLMAAGNWMPELVELAGGRSIVGVAGQHAPWMSWDELVELDPDVIIALPCGFDISRTRRELPPLTGRPGWSNLRAVANGRAYVADEALEIMAEMLHPGAFDFGHRDTGWQPL
jgi:iron complex transport system substrate-binding protein